MIYPPNNTRSRCIGAFNVAVALFCFSVAFVAKTDMGAYLQIFLTMLNLMCAWLNLRNWVIEDVIPYVKSRVEF